MKPQLFLLVLCGIISLTGCGRSREQAEAARMDRQVERDWMDGHEVVNAIEFFEKGGHYEDGDPELSSVDRDHVLPLAKRLQKELDLQPLVVLLDSETAFAMVAELPTEEASRVKLRAILNEADDAFPGFLFDNWGQKWLSLDFLNELETQAIKDAGALESLTRRNR